MQKRIVSISLPSREFHNVSMHDDVSWTKTDDYIFCYKTSFHLSSFFLLTQLTNQSHEKL